MESLLKDMETSPPTPGTLVMPTPHDSVEKIGNVGGRPMESNLTDEYTTENEVTATGEDKGEAEYASGIKLGFILSALALSIFLVYISLSRSRANYVAIQRVTNDYRSP